MPSIKKVYLINQDYSFGQSVRTQAKAMLAAKRPDIKIVGDELHPLLKITDFAPYIAKIKASGADTVITGNWGQDFALLLKAAADAGLKVNWYTYYAGGTGGPTAIKQANLEPSGVPDRRRHCEHRQCAVAGIRKGVPRQVRLQPVLSARRQRNADAGGGCRQGQVDRSGQGRAALEGMKFDVFNGGKGYMRKDDHQFFQPMYISSFGDSTDKEPFDEEKTGWGWKTGREDRHRGDRCCRPPARWNGRTDRSRVRAK